MTPEQILFRGMAYVRAADGAEATASVRTAAEARGEFLVWTRDLTSIKDEIRRLFRKYKNTGEYANLFKKLFREEMLESDGTLTWQGASQNRGRPRRVEG